MKKQMLVVHNLTRIIGTEKILDQVSFQVPEGKICAFVGHNGAGKTTTIKSIMGLYRYDSGTVTINGISSKNIKSHRNIGYVPEKENFTKVSAYKFLLMMTSLYGVKKSIIKQRIEYYTSVFQLQNRLHLSLSRMSSGQKKKVMIIQALLHDPTVLIMDEPTENLDPDTRDTFYKVMQKLKSEGKTILISTHNLDEIQNFADQIIILIGGKIKYSGTHSRDKDIHAIYNKYKPKVVL